MMKTQQYRQQHESIKFIIQEIRQLLTEENFLEQLGAIRKNLSALTGKLKVHLLMEDEFLYPRMLKNREDTVRETAQKYAEEMGNMNPLFAEYTGKWRSRLAVEEAPALFKRETQEILEKLMNRIDRENNELYALFDHMKESF